MWRETPRQLATTRGMMHIVTLCIDLYFMFCLPRKAYAASKQLTSGMTHSALQ
jgi:hypothetical protein